MTAKHDKIQTGFYSYIIAGASIVALGLFAVVVSGRLVSIVPVTSEAQLLNEPGHPVPTTLVSQRNLVQNGGFESSAATWNDVDGGRLETRTDETKYAGYFSFRFWDSVVKRHIYQDIPVVAGRSYEVSSYVKTSGIGTGQKAQMTVNWRTGIGVLSGVRSETFNQVAVNQDWRQVKHIISAPEGATVMRLNLELTQPDSPRGAANFDDVKVIEVSAPDFAIVESGVESPTVYVGGNQYASFRIQNVGTMPGAFTWTVSNIKNTSNANNGIAYPHNGGADCTNTVFEPGASCELGFRLQPINAGKSYVELTIQPAAGHAEYNIRNNSAKLTFDVATAAAAGQIKISVPTGSYAAGSTQTISYEVNSYYNNTVPIALAFLMKDDKVLGHLYVADHDLSKKTMTWYRTAYLDADKTVRLAQPGNGYKILMGIKNDESYPTGLLPPELNRFSAYDMSRAFIISGPPAFDYSITHRPNDLLTVVAGNSTEETIDVWRAVQEVPSEEITLQPWMEQSANAKGISLSLGQTKCTPNCTTTLKVSTHRATPAGTYEIAVIGQPYSRITKMQLIVIAGSYSFTQGSTVELTQAVVAQNTTIPVGTRGVIELGPQISGNQAAWFVKFSNGIATYVDDSKLKPIFGDE